MRTSYILLIALLIAGGCYIGQEAGLPYMATRPTGSHITLQIADREIAGELLSVEANALVVRTENPTRLISIALAAVESGSALQVDEFGSELSRGVRRRLQRVSRFPQGIDAELETELLRSHGLTAMERIEP